MSTEIILSMARAIGELVVVLPCLERIDSASESQRRQLLAGLVFSFTCVALEALGGLL